MKKNRHSASLQINLRTLKNLLIIRRFWKSQLTLPIRHMRIVKKYWDLMHEFSFDEIQEMYTYTFDFQKETTLFMTYVKYEDAKDRGQMLAKLKVLYEMFGLNMPEGELSDFLPLMCEFIYAAEWIGDDRAPQSFGMLLAVMEDGSYHLLKALEKHNSPYFYLIKGMRETFKSCIRQEAQANE